MINLVNFLHKIFIEIFMKNKIKILHKCFIKLKILWKNHKILNKLNKLRNFKYFINLNIVFLNKILINLQ